MFPIGDENPTLKKPLVTYGIIAINVIMWIFIQQLGMEPMLSKSICNFGLIPAELLHKLVPGTTIPISENYSCRIDEGTQWYTLFSSMFMHGGWFHLISNMWFLAVFGDNVEDGMGSKRFLVFYILCGLAAAGLQIVSNPASKLPMVGASGAIGGVMGGYAVMYPKARVHLLVILGFLITRIIVPAYFMLGYWFVLQILGAIPTLNSQAGGVAFFAHVGGFLMGVALTFLFRNRKRLYIHDEKFHIS